MLMATLSSQLLILRYNAWMAISKYVILRSFEKKFVGFKK
jgi:hypothetical protein